MAVENRALPLDLIDDLVAEVEHTRRLGVSGKVHMTIHVDHSGKVRKWDFGGERSREPLRDPRG